MTAPGAAAGSACGRKEREGSAWAMRRKTARAARRRDVREPRVSLPHANPILTGSSSWTKSSPSPSSRGRRTDRQVSEEVCTLPASAAPTAMGHARRVRPLRAQAWPVGESTPEEAKGWVASSGGRRNWAAGAMVCVWSAGRGGTTAGATRRTRVWRTSGVGREARTRTEDTDPLGLPFARARCSCVIAMPRCVLFGMWEARGAKGEGLHKQRHPPTTLDTSRSLPGKHTHTHTQANTQANTTGSQAPPRHGEKERGRRQRQK